MVHSCHRSRTFRYLRWEVAKQEILSWSKMIEKLLPFLSSPASIDRGRGKSPKLFVWAAFWPFLKFKFIISIKSRQMLTLVANCGQNTQYKKVLLYFFSNFVLAIRSPLAIVGSMGEFLCKVRTRLANKIDASNLIELRLIMPKKGCQTAEFKAN